MKKVRKKKRPLPTATAEQIIAMNPCWTQDSAPDGQTRIRDLVGRRKVNALQVLASSKVDFYGDKMWLACHLLPVDFLPGFVGRGDGRCRRGYDYYRQFGMSGATRDDIEALETKLLAYVNGE